MFRTKLKQEFKRIQAELSRSQRLGLNLAHELRTPAQSLVALTELLNTSQSEQEKKELQAALTKASRDLLETCDRLLNFYTTPEEQRRKDNKKSCHEIFCLQQLLNDCFYQLQTKMISKGLFFAGFVASDLAQRLSGEKTKIQQILLNLINNACKFTPTGSIIVNFSTIKAEADHVHIVCEVSDTGLGIKTHERRLIFQAFGRGKSSHLDTEGRGLGLTISQELAESMGAKLELKSSSACGSLFSLSVKLGLPEERTYLNKNFYKGLRIITAVDTPLLEQHLEVFFKELDCHFASLQDFTKATRLAKTDEFGPLCLIADKLDINASQLLSLLDEAGSQAVIVCATDPLHLKLATRQKQQHWVYLPLRSPFMAQQFLQALTAILYGLKAQQRKDLECRERKENSREILLVEDNTINQIIGCKMIEKCGFRVRTADSGTRAIESFQKVQPSLIFMDYYLPEMNGGTVAKIIRGIESARQLKPTPIIGLSAETQEKGRQDWQEHINDFIVKPVSLEQIASKIKQWVEN